MEYKITNKISEDVVKEVLAVKKESGLTPENIVKQAQNKKSKLHDLFEWDNGKAGEKWRLQQARVLINEIKLIVEDKEIYAFENVSVIVHNNQNPERQYFTRSEILSNEDFRKQIVKSAFDQLVYWQEKYQGYANEFSGVFSEIERLKEKNQKVKVVA